MVFTLVKKLVEWFKEEDQEAYGARQSGVTKNINKLSSNDDDLGEML